MRGWISSLSRILLANSGPSTSEFPGGAQTGTGNRNGDLGHTHNAIIEAYMEIVSLVQYGTQTIIHPTWDYNASYDEIMHELRSMAARLGQDRNQAVFSGAPARFVIVTYPLAEQGMVLRQALMAHEIGHYINAVQALSQTLLGSRVFNAEDRQRIEEAVRRQEPESDRDRLQEDASRLEGKFVAHWVVEATADFLGLCLLGPAYLLAFDDVSFTPRFSTLPSFK